MDFTKEATEKKTVFNRVIILAHGLAGMICLLIFGCVILAGLFVTANYDFGDFPYFSRVHPDMLFYFLFAVLVMLLSLLVGRRASWNIWVLMAVYVVVSVAYILIIPMEPFSDMYEIWNIAINDLKDNTGYLTRYGNQIPIVVFLWAVSSVFGKNILVPKSINILCNLLILYFLGKMYALLSDGNCKKCDKRIMWFAAPFVPAVLYVNHIYNDILFTLLSLMLVYYVLSLNESRMKFVLICLLSVFQYLLRPTGIINIIAVFMFGIFYWNKWQKGILYAIVVILCIAGIGGINASVFHSEPTEAYPVWSFIQMGVNENEFGFQDGTHSSEWTFQDCVKKYHDLGPYKVLKIWAKKELWMWLEGTYQAERYGFGDANVQYTRDNSLTESLRDINQSKVRIFFEQFMKAQYYLYILLAGLGLFSNNKRGKKYDLFLYIIAGFFCFYLIWEIKSRYIYSLYPIIMVFAFDGLNRCLKCRRISNLYKKIPAR